MTYAAAFLYGSGGIAAGHQIEANSDMEAVKMAQGEARARHAELFGLHERTGTADDGCPLVRPREVSMIRVYLRVSTGDQSVDSQRLALQQAVQARGQSWASALVYTDAGLSGANANRPALRRLLAEVQRGDVVMCWALDRISRSLEHLCNIVNTLEARGAALVSLRETIDLSTPSGRMLVGILGSVAQFQRDIIIQNTKAGIEAARAKGRHPGRRHRVEPTGSELAVLDSHIRHPELSGRALAQLMGIRPNDVHRALQRVRPTP
jgi:DNA invertase Pin-like site-specific DNA recombinase